MNTIPFLRITKGISFLLYFFLHFACPPSSAAQDTLRVGIIRHKTPNLLIRTYSPLFTKVAEHVEKVVKIQLVEESDLGFMLNDSQFDIGLFPPFPYMQAKQDFPALEVFGSHLIEGSDHFQGAILVHISSPIKRLEDLRGKQMMFVKPTSTSGFLFPKGVLKEHQIDIEAGDLSFQFSGGHDLSLHSLLKKQVDAIAVDQHELMDMDSLLKELSPIFTYSIPYHAYVFAPNYPPEEREQIKEFMFQAHRNPKSKEVFENPLEISQWVLQNDTYYNPLRRLLQFVRVKPTVKLNIDVKDRARDAFKMKGDFLDLLYDNIANEIRETQRFFVTDITNQNHFHVLELVISLIDEKYHCQIYLDDKRIEYFDDVSLSQFLDEIPLGITQAILDEFVIESEILGVREDWHITYGTNDGLALEEYEFSLLKPGAEVLPLDADDIVRIDPLNTYLDPSLPIEEGDSLVIRYKGTSFQNSLHSSMPQGTSYEEGFWDNKDNQWGVIGLIVTLIGVMLGAFLSKRKKKRFRTMLYESNRLLLEYIQGRYKLDNEIIAHKDKINQFLEKGYISENQYLILRNRVEDIHNLIHQIMNHPEELEEPLRREVEGIIDDGVITEKEYSRLVALVQQIKRD